MSQTENSQSSGLKKLVLNGKTIEIVRSLGAGLTADVYQAFVNEKDAAIKVLKPGSSPEVRKFFLTEMNNISEVRKAWTAFYPGIPQVVPEIIGGEKEGDMPSLKKFLLKYS